MNDHPIAQPTLALNATVFVTIIEWDGGTEPDCFVALTEGTSRLLAVELLRSTWVEHPAAFYDQSPDFMEEDEGSDVPLVADKDIDDWIAAFQESTTSPWVTTIEKVIEL